MKQHRQAGLVLPERSDEPDVATGTTVDYADTEGNRLRKNDTGAVVRLDDLSGSGGGDAGHLWTPKEFELVSSASDSPLDNVYETPAARMDPDAVSYVGSPWWPASQTFIDALDTEEIVLQFGVEAAGTGDAKLELLMGHRDDSDESFQSETRSQTISVVNAEAKVIEQEFSALSASHIPAIGDWFQFQIERDAAHMDDDLTVDLYILWMKILTKTASGS